MKAKKGSKAWRAKVSKSQKASWKKRKAKAGFDGPVAYEEVPVSLIKPTQEQLDTAASYRVETEQLANDVAENLKRAWRENNQDIVKAWKNADGSTTHRWSSSAGINPSNIPKEDTTFAAKERHSTPWEFAAKPFNYDPVNSPAHYLRHPSGIECITVTEHFNFNRGNAIKYIWRADEKGSTLENLRKARWYLDREIQRLEKEAIR